MSELTKAQYILDEAAAGKLACINGEPTKGGESEYFLNAYGQEYQEQACTDEQWAKTMFEVVE